MAGKIFVSYRRDDSRADARGIRDRLARVYGERNVFMDVDKLKPGQRFDVALADAMAQCEVLICVIGPRWLELLEQRMATGDRDYVREEVASALHRGVLVIPVVIDRTSLPKPDQLPDDIRNLVLHQKHDITHERFGRDVQDLIDAINAERRDRRTARAVRPYLEHAWIGAAVGLVLLIGLYYLSRPTGPSSSSTAFPIQSGGREGGPSMDGVTAAESQRRDSGTTDAERDQLRTALSRLQLQAAQERERWTREAQLQAEQSRAAATSELGSYAADLANARRITSDAERRVAELRVETARLGRNLKAFEGDEQTARRMLADARTIKAGWERELASARLSKPVDQEIGSAILRVIEDAIREAGEQENRALTKIQSIMDARQVAEEEQRRKEEELRVATIEASATIRADEERRVQEEYRRRETDAARVEAAAAAARAAAAAERAAERSRATKRPAVADPNREPVRAPSAPPIQGIR